MLAAGFTNTQLTDTMAMLASRLGRPADALRLLTMDRFLHVAPLTPALEPHDMAELASALQQDLTHYRRPRSRPIRHAARREGLTEATDGPPALKSIFARIRHTVAAWIAALPRDPAHPFLAAKPAQSSLEGWSVVSGRDSHHQPHIHVESWANGVYYVEIPPEVEDASRRAGWLRVGPPPAYGFGDADGWPERWIRPAPGLMVIMPSHFHHETRPLGVGAKRIALAFQIRAETPPSG